MPVRTRNRTESTLSAGYYWVAPSSQYDHSVTHGLTEKCEDVVGNFPYANPLKITQSRIYIPVIDGQTRSTLTGEIIRRMVTNPLGSGTRVQPPSLSSVYPTPSSGQQAALAWKILAESNPSAPAVSVPTFIGELKDLRTLPVRVKDWGGSLLRKVALGHITWRWAIRPMLSDIAKLFSFQEKANQRFGEIVALSKGRPLRKRVALGSSSDVSVTNNVLRHSEGFLVSYKRTRTFSIREWGSSQWKISSDTVIPKTYSKEHLKEMRRLAKKVTLGISGYESLAVAWELLPWSWFIDWFVDVGDVIAACNNTLGLTWSNVCYMRTISSRNDYELTSTWPDGYSISGVPWERLTQKERYPVSPSLAVSPSFLPFLDVRKWSILGSLAALRGEGLGRTKR